MTTVKFPNRISMQALKELADSWNCSIIKKNRTALKEACRLSATTSRRHKWASTYCQTTA